MLLDRIGEKECHLGKKVNTGIIFSTGTSAVPLLFVPVPASSFSKFKQAIPVLINFFLITFSYGFDIPDVKSIFNVFIQIQYRYR
jgi:hypothetical protein